MPRFCAILLQTTGLGLPAAPLAAGGSCFDCERLRHPGSDIPDIIHLSRTPLSSHVTSLAVITLEKPHTRTAPALNEPTLAGIKLSSHPAPGREGVCRIATTLNYRVD